MRERERCWENKESEQEKQNWLIVSWQLCSLVEKNNHKTPSKLSAFETGILEFLLFITPNSNIKAQQDDSVFSVFTFF